VFDTPLGGQEMLGWKIPGGGGGKREIPDYVEHFSLTELPQKDLKKKGARILQSCGFVYHIASLPRKTNDGGREV